MMQEIDVCHYVNESLTEIVPEDKVGVDGKWTCQHRIYGLSCQHLRCRYDGRILEVLNRHQRLATERRIENGKPFPPNCYLDPREFSEKETIELAAECQSIKGAFRKAGLRIPKPEDKKFLQRLSRFFPPR